MRNRMAPFVVLVAMAFAGNVVAADRVELANRHVAMTFDPEDGYALVSLVNRAHDVDFIGPRPEGVEQNRSLWALVVSGPNATRTLTADDARQAGHTLNGDTLAITWRGVGSEAGAGDLTVTVTARLPQASTKVYWRAEVSGSVQGWLRQLDFPRVVGIRDFADCQMSLPYYWGRLVRSPMQLGRKASLVYPEPASMQWFAFWGVEEKRHPELAAEAGRNSESGWSPDYSDACGLYWAAEDGDLHFKRFSWDPTLKGEQLAWHIENIPGLPTWPLPEKAGPSRVDYEVPYETVVGVFTGDWHEAARIYLDWAKDQVWTQRGPVDQWPQDMPDPGTEALMRWLPPWFRDIGFWAKFYHEPAKVLSEWDAYRKWLGVPMASHWYRYNVARFNDNDPEHLPPDPYLLDGVRAARELGVEPMPYVLSTIWDTDTQSWILEDGQRSALRDESGEIPNWVIGPNIFARMCLSQDQWHAKMREICRKLIWEHGMSGVYLDVLAAGAAWPCYNPDHGHPVRGGNYWGQGARRLMAELRADVRRLDPKACFFTEEIGEHLIDVMDGFLTLDLTRNYTPGGEQVWPILTAVYHPYTINFGSDAQIGMTPEVFALTYGRQLVWGSQPLHSVIVAPHPEEGNTTAEVFREYTRAYWVAGQPFLQGGTMCRLAVRPRNAAPGRCELELAADPHTVAYEGMKDRKKLWTGPAVLASAWEREGDTGIVMANLTGARQSVELTVRRDVPALHGERLVRLWPGEPEILGIASGEHALTLKPWRCGVYVLTRDPNRARARLNKLEATPWNLVAVEDGLLPTVTGPQGALFASSDGPVLNRPTDDGTEATACRWDETGALTPRHGRQAEVHGVKAEGHGLPRDLDKRPFALLRRLACTVDWRGGEIGVLSGDENHLLAIASDRAEIAFPGEGLVVVSDAVTGESLRPLSAGPVRSVVTPNHKKVMLAWARFDAEEMSQLLAFGDETIRSRVQPFADMLVGLTSCPADQRDAQLASASRQFVELAASLGDLPGLLSPVSPLTKLHKRMRALVVARSGANLQMSTDHRWLAPRVDKKITLDVFGPLPAKVEAVPVGSCCEGGFVVGQPRALDAARNVSVTSVAVRLNDGRYVERMVPILGVARLESGGQEYAVSSLLHLEANRPYQLLYDKEPVTLVAGRSRKTRINIRNWSPLDMKLQVTGSGPQGWKVVPDTPVVDSPALSDRAFDLTVTPPPDAERGLHEVRVFTNHAEPNDTRFVAVLRVGILDALVPLQPKVATWTRPALEARSRFRQAGAFAVYAAAGEQIAATISNIRVTQYVDTLSWRLFGPDMELIDRGRIAVDKSSDVSHVAETEGAYYLEVLPKQGSADVHFKNRCVAEIATPESPVKLFCSNVTRYFFVPEDATEFQLGAQDGGPTEGARFVITSPSGRVALDVDGNHHGARIPIEVQPDETGKVWTIRIEPRQDLTFWLTGDALPYLSTFPDRVLIRTIIAKSIKNGRELFRR